MGFILPTIIYNDSNPASMVYEAVGNLGKAISDAFITPQIPVTYSQLLNDINSSSLISGARYLISDYSSTYIQPESNIQTVSPIEPLTVTAISTSELQPEACSLQYPDDVIYYSYNNDISSSSVKLIPGATKGVIYRRVDTIQNNSFPFDFRQIKFRRWMINVSTNDTTGAVGTYALNTIVSKTGTAELYIKIDASSGLFTSSTIWSKFIFDNSMYYSPVANNWTLGNVNIPCSSAYTDYKTFSIDSYYNTAHNNKIDPALNDIITNSNSVIFGVNFKNNNIGYEFYKNNILSNFLNNNIKAGFNGNNVGVNFNDNTIGINFYDNIISQSYTYNVVSSGFNTNIIGFNCTANNIGYNFNNNVVYVGFTYNKVQPYLSSTTIKSIHAYQAYTSDIFTNSSNVWRLRYTNASDNLVIVNL